MDREKGCVIGRSMHSCSYCLTHNGRHDKVLVHESISVMVSLKHQEVSIMADLPSYLPVEERRR